MVGRSSVEGRYAYADIGRADAVFGTVVKRVFLLFLQASAIWLPSQPCFASAFGLREQSVSALGNAFAGGAAAADDPTYMFYNPAALALQSGSQIVALGTFLKPSTSFDLKSGSSAGGVSTGGGDGGSDASDDQFVPAVFAVVDLSRAVDVVDNLKVGLAVTSPFGLETDYNAGWAGRYYALQSKLRTVNVSPTVAFEPTDGLSVGGGVQAQYADAELSNAVDFGSIAATIPPLAPLAQPTEQDGRARFDGDDWAFGWTAGAIYQPWQGTRLGVSYRSALKHNLKGDARFRLDDDGIGNAVSNATGAFQNTGARARLETPEVVSFGVSQELNTQWSVMADAAWTRWSRVDELRVRFDNPSQPDDVTDTDWNDTWFFALGATYRPSDPWTLRAGVAYDQSPVPNRTRTPRVPDNDRYWFTLGLSYRPADSVDVTAGYAHVIGPDASVNLNADMNGSAAKGNLSGNVDATVDIVGMQIRWIF
jgi:long-chain fatty acid transport protein